MQCLAIGSSPRDMPVLNLEEATPTPLHLLCLEVSTVLIMVDNESQILLHANSVTFEKMNVVSGFRKEITPKEIHVGSQ